MNETPNQNPPDPIMVPPLNFATKLAFGAGDLGTAITANLSVFFLLFFFTNVAGLPAGLAGSVLMIGKIWDAFNDPIIGWLSDNTRSRWGRRYPWVIFGAVPFGIIFFLYWIVPPFSQGLLFGYYAIIALLFNTAYTCVNLPYSALTPELTQDYNERTSLNSFRFAFSIGGSIGSLILAQIIFAKISDPAQQYLVLGSICAIISILPFYWCFFGTRKRIAIMERLHPVTSTKNHGENLSFFQQFRIVLSNRPFLFVIGIYLCSWLSLQITASIIPYFAVNYMGLPENSYPQVAIAVQGTALPALFLWSAVSKRVGKKAVYFMGMSLWIIAQAGLFLLQPDQVPLMYILAIMAGFGVATAYLVPWSMVPDTIDLDELNTGQRREGIFYAFMVLLQKIGLAVGLFLVGVALELAGFIQRVPGAALPQQPESALLAIRIAIGPLPTGFLIVGLILAYFYPITREYHAQILLKLRERR
ncbi:MFS transporter [[Phormidium] sp. ETS-05]|uniref:MFS transporter n=1 Tax=[Phormidium] sp. ETS-05 TaxID=222819 RepID=UPI0018EF347D|nr:MFS transporter [[Phormidium] sp. ETS-05]